MKVQLHRLTRDVVCEAQIPHTNPVPGVIMFQDRAFVLEDVPASFEPSADILHYLEAVIYYLPESSVRVFGDAFARAEAQL